MCKNGLIYTRSETAILRNVCEVGPWLPSGHLDLSHHLITERGTHCTEIIYTNSVSRDEHQLPFGESRILTHAKHRVPICLSSSKNPEHLDSGKVPWETTVHKSHHHLLLE